MGIFTPPRLPGYKIMVLISVIGNLGSQSASCAFLFTPVSQDETAPRVGSETAFWYRRALNYMCAPMPSYEGSVDIHRVFSLVLDIIVHRFTPFSLGFPSGSLGHVCHTCYTFAYMNTFMPASFGS